MLNTSPVHFPRPSLGKRADVSVLGSGGSGLASARERVIQYRMPILTIRMSDKEMAATERAAKRHKMRKSEFARKAIAVAAETGAKTSEAFPYGAWKGRTTYSQAMKALRG